MLGALSGLRGVIALGHGTHWGMPGAKAFQDGTGLTMGCLGEKLGRHLDDLRRSKCGKIRGITE